MRVSRVLSRLKEGKPSWGLTMHCTDPSFFEMAALLDVQAIWMDMEHHGYSVETASNQMRATRVANTDVVARPAKGEFMRMARMLEMGATGIMYPRCDSPEEAAEVVKWSKFAPIGKRGCDTGNPDAPYCITPMTEYLKAANEQTFVIIQLEEQHAVDQADEIAAVEGVDFLMLGPGDYGVLSGFPGDMNHPKIDDAINKIASAAAKHNKHWVATCPTLDHAKRYLDLGAGLLFHGGDLTILKAGIEQIQASMLGLGIPR